MKVTRLALDHWVELLRLVVGEAARTGAPEVFIGYLLARFAERAPTDWRPHDDGWLDCDFDQWDGNARLYVESVTSEQEGAVSARMALIVERLQSEQADSSSGVNRAVDRYLDQFPQYGPWGKTCAKRDAQGAVIHAAVCFLSLLLGKRRSFAEGELRDFVRTLIRVARWYASNPLVVDQFPITLALQQIKKQRFDLLAAIRADVEALRVAVGELPFDSAQMRRQRTAQGRLADDILQVSTKA